MLPCRDGGNSGRKHKDIPTYEALCPDRFIQPGDAGGEGSLDKRFEHVGWLIRANEGTKKVGRLPRTRSVHKKALGITGKISLDSDLETATWEDGLSDFGRRSRKPNRV